MEIDVNIWAVLVCAVASMVLGFLWYGPLFSKAWVKEMGWDPNDKAQMDKMKSGAGPAYFQQFIGAIIMAYVFAHVLGAFDAQGDLSLGLQGAFWMWLGFVVPVKYGETLWGKASLKLFFIDSFYYLVLLAAYAAILTLW
jgi:hypothetical protein